MPLITKKTNLRSLKFGMGQASDRPGGGYSNQPYIVKPIPDYDDDGSNIFNTGGPDSLLRGGLMAPIKSINDVSRLTQMFFDFKSPNGLLFVAKQNVLSRSSVKTEASVGLGTAGGAVNQGVYLPTSTIAQAGVGFLGAHGNLLGINPASPGNGDPSYLQQLSSGGLVRYEDAAKNANKEDKNRFSTTLESITKTLNPLFFLNQKLLLGSESPQEPEFIETFTPSTTSGNFKNRLLDVWYNKQQQKSGDTIVLEYGGGPGSILGIGKTKIPFADQRTGINNPLAISNPSYFYSGGGRSAEIERNLEGKLKGVTNISSISPLLSTENQKEIKNFDYTPNNTVGGESFVGDRYPLESKSTYRPSPIEGTGSYLSSITSGTNQQDTNNSDNNTSLETPENSLLSPFTANNDLISTVIPESERKTYASTPQQPPSNSYLLNTSQSQQIDSNNPDNNDLLADQNELSPFTVNNDLISTVIPESERKTYASTPQQPPSSSYFTSLTSSNFTQSNHESLSEDRTTDIDEGQALSRFTINNKLIDEVVTEIPLREYASSKNSIPPNITYVGELLSDSDAKGATIDYNKLISRIPNSENSILPIDSYLNAYSFNVYDTVKGSNSSWPSNSPLQYGENANNSLTWNQSQIIGEEKNTGIGSGKPSLQDFRKKLIDENELTTSTIMSLAPDYNTKNIERRVGLGDPGKTLPSVLKYSINGVALDKINASGFTSGTVPDHGGERNDLAKFSIGILRNDGTGVSDYLNFRAFINSFDDKYNADWGETQYVGRGDKFYNYKGFNRSVSMGWTVYAQSKAELIPMYKKLNFLASSLAPDYSSGGYMRGNLARLTVGGYLYNTLGIIKSISYTVPQESTWEIGINDDGMDFDNSVKELPHMINVTGFDFIPIENTIPQKGKTRFITLTNGGNTNWGDGNVDMPIPSTE